MRASRMFVLLSVLLAPPCFAQQSTPGSSGAPASGTPPENAIANVLAEQLDSWQREGAPGIELPSTEAQLADEAALLATYRPTNAASASYRRTDGTANASVLLLEFSDQLDAMGFFAAQRGPDARRVLLTSPTFRENGLLHVYSGRYYLRIVAAAPETQALPPDQELAGLLEVRVPKPAQLPRVMGFFPLKWLTALAVSYAPADLLDHGGAPKAFSVSRTIGVELVTMNVAEFADDAAARAAYESLQRRTMLRGGVSVMPNLGQEAFASRGDAEPLMAMLQDQFVAYLTGKATHGDAEALLRTIGVGIRISRPLPSVGLAEL